MDLREQRGREIAERARIVKLGDAWVVPSQTGNGTYRVTLEAGAICCSCPDFELRRQPCKHVWAAGLFVQRQTTVTERKPDGKTVTTTVTETAAVKVSYPQDWRNYNAAQCNEKPTAQVLLRALCDGIVTPRTSGRGRPVTPLSDAVYGMVMKVYTGTSGRRATPDIEAAASAGHMTKAPSYNTIFDYLNKVELTPLLTTLVEESASPLACVESAFAADATGFSTVTYRRWFDEKYGRQRSEREWLKLHAMVGTTTNIITAARVTRSEVNDAPEFPRLLWATNRRFDLKEVSADKAYLSNKNLRAVTAVHATPFIPFKINSGSAGSAPWRRMYATFIYRQDEFLAHYHKRSNVESTFSALKRKFGHNLRSRNETAQVNELLCKALCFNLSMLVHAMYELGIDPTFAGATP